MTEFVTVPREPTEAMREAGRKEADANWGDFEQEAVAIWSAMLAAAPICKAPGCDNPTGAGICDDCDKWVDGQLVRDRLIKLIRVQLMSTDCPVSQFEEEFTDAILAALPVTPALGREGYVWLPLVDGELPPLPDGKIYGWRTTSGAIYWGEGYPVPVRKFALDRSSCGAILALYVPQPTQGADKALVEAGDLVFRIEASGPADTEAACGNVDRWKATARDIAPRLRAALSHAKDAG
jgi:hypothetical protein